VTDRASVLSDDVWAAATATAQHAHLKLPGRWPTPASITAHAALYDLPPALLGAMFGWLQVYDGKGGTRWINVTEVSPHVSGANPELVDEEDAELGYAFWRGFCRALGFTAPPLRLPGRKRPPLKVV
jgi:hypothetical protein